MLKIKNYEKVNNKQSFYINNKFNTMFYVL